MIHHWLVVFNESVVVESRGAVVGVLGLNGMGCCSFLQKRKISQKLSSFLRQTKPAPYMLV